MPKKWGEGIDWARRKMYFAWYQIQDRCTNPRNKDFKAFAQRGIRVCQDWDSFDRFLQDMGGAYKPGLRLTRRDASLGFSKENCFWESPEERRIRMRSDPERRRLLGIWLGIKDRCYNKNGSGWKNYGGRGIDVCPRWMVFDNFYEDMRGGAKPHLQIDRINNDAGYSPENCRWATKKENSRNRRGAVVTVELGRIADSLGLSNSAVHARIRLGWSVAEACSIAKHSRRPTPASP